MEENSDGTMISFTGTAPGNRSTQKTQLLTVTMPATGGIVVSYLPVAIYLLSTQENNSPRRGRDSSFIDQRDARRVPSACRKSAGHGQPLKRFADRARLSANPNVAFRRSVRPGRRSLVDSIRHLIKRRDPGRRQLSATNAADGQSDLARDTICDAVLISKHECDTHANDGLYEGAISGPG